MDDKELKDVLYNRLQANGVDVSRNPIAGTAASVKTGAVEGTKQAVNNAASFVKTDLTNTEYAGLERAKLAAQNNVDYDSFMDRMADKYGFKVRILKQSIMDDADKEMYFSAAAAKDLGINNIDDWNRINNEYNTKLGNIESERSAKQQESIAKQQETDRKYMLGTVGEFAQDLGSAAGNMAPSLGLGLINPALGLASFGTQAAAQSYGQALDEGATHEQATRYGVATGLKEAAIERLTGGLSRFYGKGILDNVIGVQPNNTLRNVILNTAKGAAGEGAEEALSGAIDPFLQRATYNPEVENADIGDLAYQAAIGAALGGILGGGSNVVDYGVSRNAARTQQNATQQAQTQERTNATTAESDQLKGVVEQPTMGENQGVGVNVSENMGVSEPQRTFTAEQQQQTVPNVENVETRNVNNEPYAQAMENIMNEPTKEQQELKRFVEIAANNANMSVKYEDMPASQRSYYSDGVIHINRNLPIDKTIKTTTAHEIYHGLEGTKEHDKIIELALKNMGIDETTAIAQKKAQYKNDANIDLDDVGARAEIGAEFIEKAMSDEATINTVLTESPSLARRILQKIKDMIDVFKKRKTMTPREREQYSSLLKARQLYESGIAKLSSGKYEPAETGGRYAISNQATQQTATKPKNGVGYRFFDNTFQKSETFDDAVKEIERTYEHEREKRVSEKETLEEARKRLQDDWKKEFETVLKKNSLSGADTDVAMGIIGELNNYEPGTDGFERIMKFAEEYADKTVESGQFIQALAKYTRTPMGKTQKAMRDVKREERKLQEENPKKWNEAQKVISKVKEQVKQAENDATEETINVVSKNTVNEIEKKAKKTQNKAKKTQNKGENKDDAEILAEKISWHVDEPNADSTENARLQKDIINELYRLAKESPLPDKAINVQKTDYVQLLNEIIHNRSKYENVWDRAREIVGAKYKDDPEKMKVLEDFFNNYTVPIYSKASMEKAISAELEKMQTNITEIVKQNKDDRKATIEQVKKLLSEDLNLDILDAQTKDIVANDIVNTLESKIKNEIEKKAKKTQNKAKKTQNKGENKDDAEILAEKISWHVDEPNADSTENARLQKDIINELYRLAKESPLPDKAINVQKTDYVQLLNEIIHNRSKYENVWDRAREIVGAKYKDDPEKMKVLEDFFNNYTVPIYSKASMEKAISAELEKMQTNITEIVKQNKDDRKATIEQVKKLLSEDLNLDILDAQTKDIVANDIVNTLESKIKKELSKKMDKFLDNTIKEKAKNEPLKKQLLRMIKNNEFNEDETARIIKKAYDIPTLTSEETRQIMNYYEKANEYEEGSYNYRKWESKANQIIEQKTPKSLYDKNKAYRRIMMLLNPATMERNIFGNVIYGVAELAKNIPAGLVDIAVSKKTGQRTTSANVVADIRAFLDGASKGTREWAQDIKYGVDTSYNTVREEYQTQGGFTFDNKKVLGKALNKAEYIMSKGLQLGDRPFYEGAYSQRLNELKRLGYDTKNEEVQLGAHIYALERVYQNDSAISKALVRVRDELGLFGHFLIPFAQTPGNILDKTIDYSGVGGLARALWQLGTAKNTGNFDQKLFVDRIGRALTGTGIMALGAALYETGNLLGSDDDDYLVANAKRLAGEKEYAIKIGENYYTIDWAQPVSALLVAGAEAVKAGLEQDDLMQIGIAAGEGVINTLFAMSCLESLSSLTSSYGEANAAEKISGVFIDGISQYFPTSLRRLNNVIDPYQRQTYDPNTIKKQAKYIISGIPLLSYLLEPKYTLEGEVQLKSQGRGTASRIMENFLVPYNKSEEYHSPVNDELIRLYESTGKTSQLLRFADKKLDLGDSGTYVLNTKEYNEMQKEIGKNTATAYSDLMRNSVYKSMDDFEKVEALSDIANFYENQYKSNYAKKNGLNYENSTYAKTKERIDKVGGWKNYFEVKQAFPDATFDTALKYKEKCDQYNIDYEAYADAKTSISDLRDSNSER